MTSLAEAFDMPAPPDGLTDAEASMWGITMAMFAMRKESERLLLITSAAETIVEIGRMQEALATQPTVVEGSTGQTKPNPLFGELRAHRRLLSDLLTKLDLDGSFDADDPMDRSTAGRRMALLRHHGGGSRSTD